MIPIYEEARDGAIGYGFTEFRDRFIQICSEHRTSGRALAFAFLLFDVDSPEFIKMLRDPDYWEALDQISGRYLSVFTLFTPEPRRSNANEMFYLTSVGPVADPLTKAQLVLTNHFDLDLQLKLPAVLFFQIDGEAVSPDYSLLQLQAEGVEPIFNELRAVLRDVANVVGKRRSTVADPHVVFKALNRCVRQRKLVLRLKQGKKVFASIKEIAGFAGTLI